MFHLPGTLSFPSFNDLLRKRKPKKRISNFSSISQQLLKAHFDGYHVFMSQRLSFALLRYIKSTPKYERRTPEFVLSLQKNLKCLHDYNLKISKLKYRYPKFRVFEDLLIRYVELECELLYDTFDPIDEKEERRVEQRILRFLGSVLYDSRSIADEPLHNVIKNCDKKLLTLMAKVRTDTVADNKIVNNMISKLIRKTGIEDKLNQLIGGHVVYYADTCLKNPFADQLRELLSTNDEEFDEDDVDDESDLSFSKRKIFDELLKHCDDELQNRFEVVNHKPLNIKLEDDDFYNDGPKNCKIVNTTEHDENSNSKNFDTVEKNSSRDIIENVNLNAKAVSDGVNLEVSNGMDCLIKENRLDAAIDLDALPDNLNNSEDIVTIDLLDDDVSRDKSLPFNHKPLDLLQSSEIKREENDENHSPNSPLFNVDTGNDTVLHSNKTASKNSTNTSSKLKNSHSDSAKDDEIIISDSEEEEFFQEKLIENNPEENDEKNEIPASDEIQVVSEEVTTSISTVEDVTQLDEVESSVTSPLAEDVAPLDEAESSVTSPIPEKQQTDYKEYDESQDLSPVSSVEDPSLFDSELHFEEENQNVSECDKMVELQPNLSTVQENTISKETEKGQDELIFEENLNVAEEIIKETEEPEVTETNTDSNNLLEEENEFEIQAEEAEKSEDHLKFDEEVQQNTDPAVNENETDAVENLLEDHQSIDKVNLTLTENIPEIVEQPEEAIESCEILDISIPCYVVINESFEPDKEEEEVLTTLVQSQTSQQVQQKSTYKEESLYYSDKKPIQLDDPQEKFSLNLLADVALTVESPTQIKNFPESPKISNLQDLTDASPRRRTSKVRWGGIKNKPSTKKLDLKPEPNENKRITRTVAKKLKMDLETVEKATEFNCKPECKPDDFIKLETSVLPPPNKIYAEERFSDANLSQPNNSEDSNDSCEKLFIDEGTEGKMSEKVMSVFDSETIDDELKLVETEAETPVCISIPEQGSTNPQECFILAEIDQFLERKIKEPANVNNEVPNLEQSPEAKADDNKVDQLNVVEESEQSVDTSVSEEDARFDDHLPRREDEVEKIDTVPQSEENSDVSLQEEKAPKTTDHSIETILNRSAASTESETSSTNEDVNNQVPEPTENDTEQLEPENLCINKSEDNHEKILKTKAAVKSYDDKVVNDDVIGTIPQVTSEHAMRTRSRSKSSEILQKNILQDRKRSASVDLNNLSTICEKTEEPSEPMKIVVNQPEIEIDLQEATDKDSSLDSETKEKCNVDMESLPKPDQEIHAEITPEVAKPLAEAETSDISSNQQQLETKTDFAEEQKIPKEKSESGEKDIVGESKKTSTVPICSPEKNITNQKTSDKSKRLGLENTIKRVKEKIAESMKQKEENIAVDLSTSIAKPDNDVKKATAKTDDKKVAKEHERDRKKRSRSSSISSSSSKKCDYSDNEREKSAHHRSRHSRSSSKGRSSDGKKDSDHEKKHDKGNISSRSSGEIKTKQQSKEELNGHRKTHERSPSKSKNSDSKSKHRSDRSSSKSKTVDVKAKDRYRSDQKSRSSKSPSKSREHDKDKRSSKERDGKSKSRSSHDDKKNHNKERPPSKSKSSEKPDSDRHKHHDHKRSEKRRSNSKEKVKVETSTKKDKEKEKTKCPDEIKETVDVVPVVGDKKDDLSNNKIVNEKSILPKKRRHTMENEIENDNKKVKSNVTTEEMPSLTKAFEEVNIVDQAQFAKNENTVIPKKKRHSVENESADENKKIKSNIATEEVPSLTKASEESITVDQTQLAKNEKSVIPKKKRHAVENETLDENKKSVSNIDSEEVPSLTKTSVEASSVDQAQFAKNEKTVFSKKKRHAVENETVDENKKIESNIATEEVPSLTKTSVEAISVDQAQFAKDEKTVFPKRKRHAVENETENENKKMESNIASEEVPSLTKTSVEAITVDQAQFAKDEKTVFPKRKRHAVENENKKMESNIATEEVPSLTKTSVEAISVDQAQFAKDEKTVFPKRKRHAVENETENENKKMESNIASEEVPSLTKTSVEAITVDQAQFAKDEKTVFPKRKRHAVENENKKMESNIATEEVPSLTKTSVEAITVDQAQFAKNEKTVIPKRKRHAVENENQKMESNIATEEVPSLTKTSVEAITVDQAQFAKSEKTVIPKKKETEDENKKIKSNIATEEIPSLNKASEEVIIVDQAMEQPQFAKNEKSIIPKKKRHSMKNEAEDECKKINEEMPSLIKASEEVITVDQATEEPPHLDEQSVIPKKRRRTSDMDVEELPEQSQIQETVIDFTEEKSTVEGDGSRPFHEFSQLMNIMVEPTQPYVATKNIENLLTDYHKKQQTNSSETEVENLKETEARPQELANDKLSSTLVVNILKNEEIITEPQELFQSIEETQESNKNVQSSNENVDNLLESNVVQTETSIGDIYGGALPLTTSFITHAEASTSSTFTCSIRTSTKIIETQTSTASCLPEEFPFNQESEPVTRQDLYNPNIDQNVEISPSNLHKFVFHFNKSLGSYNDNIDTTDTVGGPLVGGTSEETPILPTGSTLSDSSDDFNTLNESHIEELPFSENNIIESDRIIEDLDLQSTIQHLNNMLSISQNEGAKTATLDHTINHESITDCNPNSLDQQNDLTVQSLLNLGVGDVQNNSYSYDIVDNPNFHSADESIGTNPSTSSTENINHDPISENFNTYASYMPPNEPNKEQKVVVQTVEQHPITSIDQLNSNDLTTSENKNDKIMQTPPKTSRRPSLTTFLQSVNKNNNDENKSKPKKDELQKYITRRYNKTRVSAARRENNNQSKVETKSNESLPESGKKDDKNACRIRVKKDLVDVPVFSTDNSQNVDDNKSKSAPSTSSKRERDIDNSGETSNNKKQKKVEDDNTKVKPKTDVISIKPLLPDNDDIFNALKKQGPVNENFIKKQNLDGRQGQSQNKGEKGGGENVKGSPVVARDKVERTREEDEWYKKFNPFWGDEGKLFVQPSGENTKTANSSLTLEGPVYFNDNEQNVANEVELQHNDDARRKNVLSRKFFDSRSKSITDYVRDKKKQVAEDTSVKETKHTDDKNHNRKVNSTTPTDTDEIFDALKKEGPVNEAFIKKQHQGYSTRGYQQKKERESVNKSHSQSEPGKRKPAPHTNPGYFTSADKAEMYKQNMEKRQMSGSSNPPKRPVPEYFTSAHRAHHGGAGANFNSFHPNSGDPQRRGHLNSQRDDDWYKKYNGF